MAHFFKFIRLLNEIVAVVPEFDLFHLSEHVLNLHLVLDGRYFFTILLIFLLCILHTYIAFFLMFIFNAHGFAR